MVIFSHFSKIHIINTDFFELFIPKLLHCLFTQGNMTIYVLALNFDTKKDMLKPTFELTNETITE